MDTKGLTAQQVIDLQNRYLMKSVEAWNEKVFIKGKGAVLDPVRVGCHQETGVPQRGCPVSRIGHQRQPGVISLDKAGEDTRTVIRIDEHA